MNASTLSGFANCFRKPRNTMKQSIVRRLTASLLVLPLILHLAESLCPHPSTISRLPSSSALLVSSERLNGVGQAKSLSRNTFSRARTMVLRATEVSKADEKQEETPEKPIARKVRISDNPVSKFRKLKDIMWIREAVEDLTATEFACAVGSEQKVSDRKQKRAVDYEKLLSQLDRRVSDMICVPLEEIEVNGSELKLEENQGMARFAYTKEQRTELLKRILNTRKKLAEIMRGHESKIEKEDEFGIHLPEMPGLSIDIPKEEDASSSSGPKLYVRDDGTVDWDGALQDRAALKEFGNAVWARINGQNADDISDDDDGVDATQRNHGGHDKPAVTVKIEDTPEIREARDVLNDLRQRLSNLQTSHTALLNSGISAGQAVANVNLASLNPELRTKIRLSAEALNALEQQVSFQTLVYELERIYTYLATELGNPMAKGYVPLQDRLNVAEYGLLESQVESCHRYLEAKGAFDEDILAVIAEQMTDFKRRLGIDYYVSGLTYDKEAIQTWLNDGLVQTKNGLAFYVKGCQLFWNDVLYCARLIARAAQGYTLKPREVRNLRRTFKDLITFIPFIIILIIPLTPIGHVLVFGAIQRFFPDFFPSCFTEQRQNLLQLYETTEFSEFTINENLRERFSRFLEAIGFTMASRSRSLYLSLMRWPQSNDSSEDQA